MMILAALCAFIKFKYTTELLLNWMLKYLYFLQIIEPNMKCD